MEGSRSLSAPQRAAVVPASGAENALESQLESTYLSSEAQCIQGTCTGAAMPQARPSQLEALSRCIEPGHCLGTGFLLREPAINRAKRLVG